MGKHRKKNRKLVGEIEINGLDELRKTLRQSNEEILQKRGVVKDTGKEVEKFWQKDDVSEGGFNNVVRKTEIGVKKKRRTDVTPRFLTKIQREESAKKLKEARKLAKEVANREKRRNEKGVKKRGLGQVWHELNADLPWLKFALVALIVLLPWCEMAMMREVREREAGQYGEIALVAPPKAVVSVREKDLAGKKLVALTFDDGPSASTTGRLLDILKEKQVKATFFVVGTMAQKAPELVKREDAEGHEVASHTLAHNNLARMSSDEIKGEQAAFEGVMRGILGRDIELMRPPYGAVGNAARLSVEQPMILWSVDPEDWKNRNAGTVRTRVVNAVYDGSIVLMHDIHATTVDAVAGIIDDLRAAGYEFLTVSELAEVRGVKMERGATYGSFR